ncbi:MAG: tetratricopeptide repeat protein [Salinivenus sp.]
MAGAPTVMKRVCAAYLVLGVALWPVPLLNVLQAESAAVVAFAAFFVAGWGSLRAFRAQNAPVGRVLAQHLGAAVIPLVLLLVAQLWAPNCTVGQGLLFYLLFPGATVVLAVALGYLLAALPLERPGFWIVALGLGVSLLGPVYDLGFHPQFYTYNHVFGGVLGPIYDEQLSVRSGLFVFRGLTLLWAAAAFFAGQWLRGRRGGVGLLLCLLTIGFAYAYAGPLGLNTTPQELRTALGGHHQTEHFDLYYDPVRLDSAAVAALAADHEAHYARLQRRLETDEVTNERIQSYIYPSPEVKGRLTGARTTSVAPVWLAQPQVHLLHQRVEQSLGHELAHVAGRSYGLPLLKASWAPGLVEGWAVALEPPTPAPSPHDRMATAWATDTTATLDEQAEALARRLSPWGFWSGRGAVSYTTMGSFVTYLLRAYGPEPLQEVYAWGNFEAVYGRPVRQLATEWVAHVQNRQMVSSSSYEVVSQQFSRPSLFEKKCPHFVPPAQRHLQAARQAERRRDTARARTHLDAALEEAPRSPEAHAARARLRLAEGDPEAARRQLDTLSLRAPAPGLLQLRADAHVLTGQPDTARALYRRAVAQTPRSAPDQRVRRMLRTTIADRPDVVRRLVSGDSAHVQARRLGRLEYSPATAAWRALRWHDAHRYEKAVTVWRELQWPSDGWPRAWRQVGSVQRGAWHAEAAARAGHPHEARRMATAAVREARQIGADPWARTLRRWTEWPRPEEVRQVTDGRSAARGEPVEADRVHSPPGPRFFRCPIWFCDAPA